MNESLDRLSKKAPRACEVVELRFIVGLSVVDVARELGVSPRTVKSDTRFALAWRRSDRTEVE